LIQAANSIGPRRRAVDIRSSSKIELSLARKDALELHIRQRHRRLSQSSQNAASCAGRGRKALANLDPTSINVGAVLGQPFSQCPDQLTVFRATDYCEAQKIRRCIAYGSSSPIARLFECD
jgi:hypothetical protein